MYIVIKSICFKILVYFGIIRYIIIKNNLKMLLNFRYINGGIYT